MVKRSPGAVVGVMPIVVALQPTNTLPEHEVGTSGVPGDVAVLPSVTVVVFHSWPFTIQCTE